MSQPQTFDGFGRGVVPFFQGLQADNSREYWLAHKAVFESDVADPLRNLAAALGDEFGTVKVYRPNRDLRFTADRRPYQEQARLGASSNDSAGGLFLQVSVDGLFLGGGCFHLASDQVDRWRIAVADDAVAADLLRTIESLLAAGFPLLEGDSMTGTPRGWSKDHPRIGLIRRRNLAVGRFFEPDVLYSKALLDIVRHGWSVSERWLAWLDEHIGPADQTGGRT